MCFSWSDEGKKFTDVAKGAGQPLSLQKFVRGQVVLVNVIMTGAYS